MFSVVFIDVPATLDPAAVTTMVTRCEQVLGVGRCRRGGDAFEPPGDRYYARLQSDAKLQTAKVELHLSTPEGEVIAERGLAFSAQDAPESRWVTVGLVVAGLIAAREASAAAPDSARRPAPPTAVVPHVEPEKSALWGADLGAVGGPGFAGGPYRLGGFGRFWHRLRPAPHLLLLGSVRYAARSGDLSARWMSVGAGLGATAQPTPMRPAG